MEYNRRQKIDKETLEKIKEKASNLEYKVKECIDEIKKKYGIKKGFKTGLVPWIKEHYPDNTEGYPDNKEGFSYETINNAKKHLKYILDDVAEITKGGFNTVVVKSVYNFDTDPKIEKLNRFLDYADEFITTKKVVETSKVSQTGYWYMYFLETGSVKQGYPKLGRALLCMNDNHVVMKTPDKDPHTEDYQGTYSAINPNVSFFDLETFETDATRKKKIKKKLHIKVFHGKITDTIILGSYNTFDKKIYTGALVLERLEVSGSDTSKVLKELEKGVAFFSAKLNPDEFFSIDTSIREYLSLKKKNINKVPTRVIENIEGLKSFITMHQNLSEDKSKIENRFLELEKPFVFLASPQTSIKDKKRREKHNALLDEIEKRLKEDFPEHIIHIEGSSRASETEPLRTLRILEKTRYFILLLPKTEELSFAVLQLGWALKVSKNILLIHEEQIIADGDTFYKKDIISKRLKNLKYVNPNFYIEREGFYTPEGQESIYEMMFNFIHENRFVKNRI